MRAHAHIVPPPQGQWRPSPTLQGVHAISGLAYVNTTMPLQAVEHPTCRACIQADPDVASRRAEALLYNWRGKDDNGAFGVSRRVKR
jgi:hypothetical protein